MNLKIRKSSIIISLLLILTLYFSGCIHIYFGRTLLGKEIVREVYRNVNKISMSHAFDTTTIDDVEYSETRNFTIIKDTKYFIINIKITIHTLPPEFVAYLPQEIQNFLNISTRSVTITLYNPNGSIEIVKEYTQSYSDIIRIDTPIQGSWKIKIDAIGVGREDRYQDSYSVTVFAKEPLP